MDYCSFLVTQRRVTRTRRVLDRALRALPITQHDRIWPIYINFVKVSHDQRYAYNCYEQRDQKAYCLALLFSESQGNSQYDKIGPFMKNWTTSNSTSWSYWKNALWFQPSKNYTKITMF